MHEKIINLKELKTKIQSFKNKNKKVILCHGVFDLLHLGHVKHFEEAKKYGDILIVTVTPDKYGSIAINISAGVVGCFPR